jgi:hypothetical protein
VVLCCHVHACVSMFRLLSRTYLRVHRHGAGERRAWLRILSVEAHQVLVFGSCTIIEVPLNEVGLTSRRLRFGVLEEGD